MDNRELPLKTKAELLGLNRTALYYQPVGPSAQEIAAKHRIDEIYTAHPYYGSRRIAVVLSKEMPISRPTVQHYMREMGISGICPGPNLSKRGAEHKVYPYLLRGLIVDHPNQVWGIDQLRRELRSHPEELAVVRDQVLEALLRDGRPIEQKVFGEELAHDPKLRQEVKYLVFEKLRRELAQDQSASRPGQAAPVNSHNQREQEDEFIRLARQLVMQQLGKSDGKH